MAEVGRIAGTDGPGAGMFGGVEVGDPHGLFYGLGEQFVGVIVMSRAFGGLAQARVDTAGLRLKDFAAIERQQVHLSPPGQSLRGRFPQER